MTKYILAAAIAMVSSQSFALSTKYKGKCAHKAAQKVEDDFGNNTAGNDEADMFIYSSTEVSTGTYKVSYAATDGNDNVTETVVVVFSDANACTGVTYSK